MGENWNLTCRHDLILGYFSQETNKSTAYLSCVLYIIPVWFYRSILQAAIISNLPRRVPLHESCATYLHPDHQFHQLPSAYRIASDECFFRDTLFKPDNVFSSHLKIGF